MSPVSEQGTVATTHGSRRRLIQRSAVAPHVTGNTVEKSVSAKELALASGYVLSQHFFGCNDLHYGYWEPGGPVDFSHLAAAQLRFSNVLIGQFPATVHSILDVGCGTGSVAQRLIQSGHRVDCVSPSTYLTALARKRLGGDEKIYECRFEDLHTTERYDAVMFCESLQYLDLAGSLRRAVSLLNPNGYVLIADFFSTDAPGKSPVGGGHRLRKFYDEISSLSLVNICDRDITLETAPTVSLINDAMFLAVRPIWEMAQDFLRQSRPWLSRFLHWALRRQIDKFERKQLVGAITPAAFARFKSYRLMLYQART